MIITRSDILRYKGRIDHTTIDTRGYQEFLVGDEIDLLCDYNGLWVVYPRYDENDIHNQLRIHIPIFHRTTGFLYVELIKSSESFVHLTPDCFYVYLGGDERYGFIVEDLVSINKYVFGRHWKDILKGQGVKVTVDY